MTWFKRKIDKPTEQLLWLKPDMSDEELKARATLYTIL